MIYINGLGYVNEGVYGVSAPQISQTSSTAQPATVSAFDNILSTETAKLSDTSTTKSLDDIFKEAAEKYNVPEDLLKAIGYHESRFQTDAVSSAGAIGVMQLMPSTADYLGVEDPYDPYQNIMGAAKLLGKLSDMYDGNQSLMLAAYNAGSGNVEKYGGIPPFEETQNYVAKVLSTLSSGVEVPEKDIVINASDNSTVVSTATDKTEKYDSSKEYTNKATNTDTIQNNEFDMFYKSSNLDDIFSYDDYKILMSFYENMLDIISSIGEASSNEDEASDSSLMSLYQLGSSSLSYNRNSLLS